MPPGSPPESARARPLPAALPRVSFATLGPLLALIALAVLGFAINDAFASPANLSNLLTRSAFIGIIAVGATLVITSGGLDLSVGAMSAFTAGLMIIAMNALVPSLGPGWLTIACGIGVALVLGLCAGALNGLVVTRIGIEPFIVTLGTMGIFRSLVTWLADGGTLSLDFDVRGVYRPAYYGTVLGIPFPIWVLAAMAVIGAVLLNLTAFGRRAAAIGSNELVARYSAIDVERTKLLAYVFQGLCVAIATIIYVPRLGSASAGTGLLWELEAIAAVIIGGTLLKGGYGNVPGTIIGAIILSMIDNILNLTDVISTHLNGAVQGLIIIIAVVLQRGRRQG
jgi:ribose transport system permease protein